jgi:hypothetical protein
MRELNSATLKTIDKVTQMSVLDSTQNGFAMNYCCADLEKLIHPKSGLGLMWVTNKRGTRFFLLYEKDWHVPLAEGGFQIHFCPFCGSKLIGPPVEGKVESQH